MLEKPIDHLINMISKFTICTHSAERKEELKAMSVQGFHLMTSDDDSVGSNGEMTDAYDDDGD